MIFAIDGRQLLSHMGGVQRYIIEILAELDRIAPPGMFEVVVPDSDEISAIPDGRGITVMNSGKPEQATPPGKREQATPPGKREQATPPQKAEPATPPGKPEQATPLKNPEPQTPTHNSKPPAQSAVNINIGYVNLKVVKYGKQRGLLWEQIDLAWYLLSHKRTGIFMCTIVPMLYPRGIAVIHDVMPAMFPEIAKSMGNIFARNMLLLNYRIALKFADHPVTVSENSRRDMSRLYGRPEKDISIIPNAWQHIRRVVADDGWMDRFSQVTPGEYYFCLSANRKQKNFKWIYEAAKRNPERLFLMAGTIEEWQSSDTFEAPNIIQLGYVSDGEVKSLMSHCRAFIFPSYYEGFGIPPMEALACGARIIISNTSCLPEIYGDSAHYIDPDDPGVDLDRLLSEPVAPAEKCLERFGWDKSAAKLLELCRQIGN